MTTSENQTPCPGCATRCEGCDIRCAEQVQLAEQLEQRPVHGAAVAKLLLVAAALLLGSSLGWLGHVIARGLS